MGLIIFGEQVFKLQVHFFSHILPLNQVSCVLDVVHSVPQNSGILPSNRDKAIYLGFISYSSQAPSVENSFGLWTCLTQEPLPVLEMDLIPTEGYLGAGVLDTSH